MTPTSVAVLTDDGSLRQWQRAAFEEASDVLQVRAVVDCKAERPTGSDALLFTWLTRLAGNAAETRRSRVIFGDCESFELPTGDSGTHAILPDELRERLRDLGVTLLVDFSGGRCGRLQPNGLPILRFHGYPGEAHGGFQQLLHYHGKCRVTVSVTHEAGRQEVYAAAFSKIFHHSYRRTAESLFFVSRYLLRKAVIGHRDAMPVEVPAVDIELPAPTNGAVLLLLAKLTVRKLRRWFYGAFVEKRWKVATVAIADRPLTNLSLRRDELVEVPIASGYTFYADPFYSVDGRLIRLEALKKGTGLGDIVEIDANSGYLVKVLLTGAHHSYPFAFSHNGAEFLLPEVASHSRPFLLRLDSSGEKHYLSGLGEKRLLDATLLEHGGTCFLFFGEEKTAESVLHLYYAEAPEGPYCRHPSSPVVIDPEAARMAGRVVLHNGELLRFGQDNRFGYGAAISVCCVTALDRQTYAESRVGRIELDRVKGPHTIDVCKGTALIDCYQEVLSPLAGYRRWLARRSQQNTDLRYGPANV